MRVGEGWGAARAEGDKEGQGIEQGEEKNADLLLPHKGPQARVSAGPPCEGKGIEGTARGGPGPLAPLRAPWKMSRVKS